GQHLARRHRSVNEAPFRPTPIETSQALEGSPSLPPLEDVQLEGGMVGLRRQPGEDVRHWADSIGGVSRILGWRRAAPDATVRQTSSAAPRTPLSAKAIQALQVPLPAGRDDRGAQYKAL